MSCEFCSAILKKECELLDICANSNSDAEEVIDFGLHDIRGAKPVDTESNIVPAERRHGTGKAPIQWITARVRESVKKEEE